MQPRVVLLKTSPTLVPDSVPIGLALFFQMSTGVLYASARSSRTCCPQRCHPGNPISEESTDACSCRPKQRSRYCLAAARTRADRPTACTAKISIRLCTVSPPLLQDAICADTSLMSRMLLWSQDCALEYLSPCVCNTLHRPHALSQPLHAMTNHESQWAVQHVQHDRHHIRRLPARQWRPIGLCDINSFTFFFLVWEMTNYNFAQRYGWKRCELRPPEILHDRAPVTRDAHVRCTHLAQCEKLKNQGVPKKDWPKMPVQPLKPKVSALFQITEWSGER